MTGYAKARRKTKHLEKIRVGDIVPTLILWVKGCDVLAETINKKYFVYIHKSPSNKFYVGITSQTNPEKRWKHGAGYRENDHFNKAIKKYGWRNFEHKIVASDVSEQEAKNLEKMLISILRSNQPDYGYNLTSGGDAGGEMQRIPVCQFTLDGELVAEYKSENEARDYLVNNGYGTGDISACCKGKLFFVHNFAWFYKSDCDDLDKIKSIILERKQRVEEGRMHGPMTNAKKIYQLDEGWNIIATFASAGAAQKAMGLKENSGSLRAACKKGTRCRGYYWAYAESYEKFKDKKKRQLNSPVLQFTLDGNFIQEYNTIKDAEDHTGYSASSLRQACNGTIHTSHGYLWRYKYQYHGEKLKAELPSFRMQSIVQFDLNKHFIKEYKNIADAANQNGYVADTIGKCCRGVKEKYKDSFWRFAHDCKEQSDGSFLFPKENKEVIE